MYSQPLPIVVYCHCNSGSRRDAEEALYVLLPQGISVFCLDFAVSSCLLLDKLEGLCSGQEHGSLSPPLCQAVLKALPCLSHCLFHSFSLPVLHRQAHGGSILIHGESGLLNWLLYCEVHCTSG